MSLRQERVATLSQEVGRELATKTALFQHAMAAELGLTVTDLKCLDLLRQAPMPLTAVNLADLTGMTGGAITAVVDRLEAAGFVERERSLSDRRRWHLCLLPEGQESVDALFTPLSDAMADLCRDYSDNDLGVVVNFLTKLGPVMDDETDRLRRQARRHRPPTTA